jgi:sugar O-acyltransferase (sialic acid O-acetyltransferase NeuD family)
MPDAQRASSTGPRSLVIIGAGGFGREVLDVVEALGGDAHRFLGFLDDGVPEQRLLAARSAVLLGTVASLADIDAEYLIAIADPDVRRRVDTFATDLGRRAPMLVHPSATVGSLVALGPGTVVCAHASLTTNITIGRHCHINLNATIGHDTVLEDYVTVFPGSNVSGNVHLDTGVTLGTNSSIIQGRRVGANTTVGAGAAVVTDIGPGVTAVGVPARPFGTDRQS